LVNSAARIPVASEAPGELAAGHHDGSIETLAARQERRAMGITHPKYKAAVVQAAPVWIDLEGTVAKTIRYIEEAAT
jgi:hypothetical protein